MIIRTLNYGSRHTNPEPVSAERRYGGGHGGRGGAHEGRDAYVVWPDH